MKEMAALEVEELENTIDTLENRLKILLLPKDPNDEKNIMLEIRAGTGAMKRAFGLGICSACILAMPKVKTGG